MWSLYSGQAYCSNTSKPPAPHRAMAGVLTGAELPRSAPSTSPPLNERAPTDAEAALIARLKAAVYSKAAAIATGAVDEACFAVLAVSLSRIDASDHLDCRVRIGPECELNVTVLKPTSQVSEVSVIERPSARQQSVLPDPLPEEHDEDVPALFATTVPAGGLTSSLQAVAALIDDEDEASAATAAAAASPSHRKRSRASMGEAQVHLALASCDEAQPGPSPSQRQRTASASAQSCRAR